MARRRKRNDRGLVLWTVILSLAAVAVLAGAGLLVRHWATGPSVRISEAMGPSDAFPDPQGAHSAWVELENAQDRPFSLEGYALADGEGTASYVFPAGMQIPARGYLLVWCSQDSGSGYAPLTLASTGGQTLCLLTPSRSIADQAVTVPCGPGQSMVRGAGESMTASDAPTPGYPNDPAGYAALQAALSGGESAPGETDQPEAAVNYADTRLLITELMTQNRGIGLDEDGELSDWIELSNLGTESVSLGGWYLTDKEEAPNQWALPERSLAAGERLLIWASGKDRNGEGALHTSFALSEGETLLLYAPNGERHGAVTVQGVAKGASLALEEDGTYHASDYPTPGYPNDREGYEAFCAADGRSAPVLIWEAAVYDADRGDWVELKNVSGQAVDLTGYTLTDKLKDPGRMPLEGKSLAPGEIALFPCEEFFGLNAQRDEIYLLGPDGGICDCAYLREIPNPGSYGRREGDNGFFYFAQPSPGEENAAGWRTVAASPAADVAPGVYRDAESLTVSLSGERVFYTTDGSTPTENATPYTGPIAVTDTTVLRAVNLPEGQLPGRSVTLSYFLREEGSLPVVSLVTDRENLFGATGIYDKHEKAWEEDWEREASVALFEEDGSFTIDCGIQIHGRTSRRASEKRSLKLVFKGRYGGTLNYDVFGDGTVTEFSSLLLRGSLEDNYTSYMRDELFARLAMDNTQVFAQNYRYVSLYINGEYWGLYAIREHHSKNYFATHTGADADTVDMQTGEYRRPGDWANLLTYAENNNLADPAAWEYIQQHVDVPEMIEWLILECWSGDIDVYENVRFYASPGYKEGRYVYGLADMDLTMMGHNTFSVGFNNVAQLHGIIPLNLLANQEFKDMLLTRLGEMLRGPLSEENVLRVIGELRAQVEPESARDLSRWGKDPGTFEIQMGNLERFTRGRTDEMIAGAQAYFGLTAQQVQQYFGQ